MHRANPTEPGEGPTPRPSPASLIRLLSLLQLLTPLLAVDLDVPSSYSVAVFVPLTCVGSRFAYGETVRQAFADHSEARGPDDTAQKNKTITRRRRRSGNTGRRRRRVGRAAATYTSTVKLDYRLFNSCDDSELFTTLFPSPGENNYIAIVGPGNPELCEMASRLNNQRNKATFSWLCTDRLGLVRC